MDHSSTTWRDDFAYGGIVFSDSGQILMRSPAGHWGGYVWTFAKGGAEPGDDSPEETALREVCEETGYTCRILARVPGAFESDTCITKYYVMIPAGDVSDYDFETQEVRWVSRVEAFQLIQLTRTPKGRQRDTLALDSALRVFYFVDTHIEAATALPCKC